MCAVSVVYDMFGKQPDSWYTTTRINLFHSMVSDAKVFDQESGQPDCEDPEKAKVEARIANLEEQLANEDQCIYCHDRGYHGDEFTGGESYCTCPKGHALKEQERE